ncbi:uncharacterized protein LOC124450387 [Xenia sp. Carnegie-2017]|uniref:uncharacterized protein LOC124450387 n=1 Tax=Xenia sp. Carnegie-2017 TaxID=2897299 RepID=UPI001F04321B|nr:uncharacterized protein LOC124450387 [Xenia sp. Carnegie-2017]
MPKTTVTSIIENTKSLIQDTLKTVETQVKRRLGNENISCQNEPGLQEIFEEKNAIANPLKNLETEAQRRRFYKDNFGLKEPRRIILGQKRVFKRRNGVLEQIQVNDEAYYIPLLDSLQQLLNDDFILAEVRCMVFEIK